MASLTTEAQQLIMRDRLGNPLKIYGPHTISSIIMGLFFMAFAVVWTWVALSITGSPLLPTGLSILNVFSHASLSPISPDNMPGDATLNTIFSILGIVFPLFGVFFFLFGVWGIVRAIYNQGMRAVVCTDGVAFVQPSGSESFHWQDILTTFHKVDVRTSTSRNQTTGATTSTTSVSHTSTVHCHDGRKFVFKSPLARVQDLGEDIEVQFARMKHAQGQRSTY